MLSVYSRANHMSGKESGGLWGAAWSEESPPCTGQRQHSLCPATYSLPMQILGSIKGGFKGKIIFHYKLVQQDMGLEGKIGYI